LYESRNARMPAASEPVTVLPVLISRATCSPLCSRKIHFVVGRSRQK
jgi:hypothetical protein